MTLGAFGITLELDLAITWTVWTFTSARAHMKGICWEEQDIWAVVSAEVQQLNK